LPGLVRDMHFIPVRTAERAIDRAMRIMGKDAQILVVPRTRSSVVYVK